MSFLHSLFAILRAQYRSMGQQGKGHRRFRSELFVGIEQLEHRYVLADGFPAPVLISPDNGATGRSTTTLLDWRSVSGATRYRVVVDESLLNLPTNDNPDNYGNALINDDDTDGSLYRPPAGKLDDGVRYFWTVRAGASGRGGYWAAPFSFVTIPLPFDAPTLSMPVNGAIGQSTTLTLSWQVMPGANRYRMALADSPDDLPDNDNPDDFDEVDLQAPITGGATSYDVPAGELDPGAAYYWQIRAGNNDTGAGGYWSAPFSFTTSPQVPPAPLLGGPGDFSTGVSLKPNFTWQPVTGADAYRIVISTVESELPRDPGYSGDPAPANGFTARVEGTSYPREIALSSNTKYYWQVHGGRDGVGGEWSDIFEFTTAPPFPQPTLSSPANNAIGASATPALVWGALAGADRYRVVVDDVFADLPSNSNPDDFADVLHEHTITDGSSSHQVPANILEQGKKYFWRIRAGSNVTHVGGFWSEAFSFTVGEPSTFDTGPGVTAPSNAIVRPDGVKSLTIQFSELIVESMFNDSHVTLTKGGAAVGIGFVRNPGRESHEVLFGNGLSPGTYVLTVGPGITDRAGNRMNQYAFDHLGEVDQVNGEDRDKFVATITVVDEPPYVVNMAPRGQLRGPVDHVDIAFSEAIAPSTLSAGISLTRNGSSATITSIVESPPGSNVYRITFLQATSGLYMVKVERSVTDAGGVPLREVFVAVFEVTTTPTQPTSEPIARSESIPTEFFGQVPADGSFPTSPLN